MAMTFDICGIGYFLQISANANTFGFEVRIVDEAFRRVPLKGNTGNASKIIEFIEAYSGTKLDGDLKSEVMQYFWRAFDPEANKSSVSRCERFSSISA